MCSESVILRDCKSCQSKIKKNNADVKSRGYSNHTKVVTVKGSQYAHDVFLTSIRRRFNVLDVYGCRNDVVCLLEYNVQIGFYNNPDLAHLHRCFQ